MTHASIQPCASIRPRLALLSGNDLPAHDARQAWAHLAGCAECRDEWQAFRQARAALAETDVEAERLPDGSQAEEFFADLQRSVLAAVSAPPIARTSRGTLRWAGRLAGGVAAACLVVAGATLFSPAAKPDLLTRAGIRSEPIPGDRPQGQTEAMGWPLQGLGAQQHALQDLPLLLDAQHPWGTSHRTRELVEERLWPRRGRK